jgi:hypothetical protein
MRVKLDIRRPWRFLRLGDSILKHHDQHGTVEPRCAAVLRPARAGGQGRAHPGQDRRIEKEGNVDGRRGSAG